MRTKPIDIPEAVDLLERAMATQGPDFVYNPMNRICFYEPLPAEYLSYDDDPRLVTGCLIGVALDLAGETRHRWFRGTITELYNQAFGFGDVVALCTRGAVMVFQAAQHMQDNGGTWGKAVTAAKEAVASAEGWDRKQ